MQLHDEARRGDSPMTSAFAFGTNRIIHQSEPMKIGRHEWRLTLYRSEHHERPLIGYEWRRTDGASIRRRPPRRWRMLRHRPRRPPPLHPRHRRPPRHHACTPCRHNLTHPLHTRPRRLNDSRRLAQRRGGRPHQARMGNSAPISAYIGQLQGPDRLTLNANSHQHAPSWKTCMSIISATATP